MKGKSTFTHKEINEIKYLIELRSDASRDEQKSLRDKLRKIGFYISDYKNGSHNIVLIDGQQLAKYI